MFALRKSADHQGKCIPNVLPCRINHNGTVNANKRFWAPGVMEDGKLASYFRGRKLYGKEVKVPEGYRGVVVVATEKALPQEKDVGCPGREHQRDEEMQEEETLVIEEKADFEEVMVWGHEAFPDEGLDPYIIGMRDWIRMAGKIHDLPIEGNNAVFVEKA